MAIIHSYREGEPESGDKLLVTDAAGRETKSVSVDSLAAFVNGVEPVEPVEPVDPVDPITDTLIHDDYIIEAYYDDPSASTFTDPDNAPYYGTIDKWDVSQVTNLDGVFSYVGVTINAGDLTNWDVSNVTSMDSTFEGYDFSAEAMGDLSGWDVSSVADMSYTFSSSNFNGDISAWDVSNVVFMNYMFNFAEYFDQDISAWDVSNVTSMDSMFGYARAFNQNIGSWDVSNVEDMDSMFYDALVFDQPINGWNTSKVRRMDFMFFAARNFNRDLYSWDVSNVTTMRSMFDGAEAFSSDVAYWDTSNVTDMSYMCAGTNNFGGGEGINSWDTRNVTNMSYMFYKADFNGWISSWDVSNVTSMVGMFQENSTFNRAIGNWDVSNVYDMRYMFYDATNFYQDTSSWNVFKITERPPGFTAYAPNTSREPEWGVNKLKGTAVRAEGVEVANIVDYHDLTTKEYVDDVSKYNSLLTPTLETLDNLGGISIGTKVEDLSGKSFIEMFDLLLFPTILPIVQSNPSISLGNPGSFFEFGDEKSLTVSITPSKGEIYLNGAYSQDRAGDVTSVSVTGITATFNTPSVSGGVVSPLQITGHTVQLGENDWTVTANFGFGPIPLDSTGNIATNISPYFPGAVNKKYKFEGVHPILAGTETNDTAKEPLRSHGSTSVVVSQNYSETSSVRHQIWVSEAFIGGRTVTIQALNILNGNYETVPSGTFSASNQGFDLNGHNIGYIKYEKQGSLSGENTFKLIFN